MARLSYDPFGLTRLPETVAGAAPGFGQGMEMFGSPDGQLRILYVQASKDLRTYRECDDWLKRIQPIVEAAASSAGITRGHLGYTGRPAFVAETALGMEHDITISVGGTAAIIALLFWLAHRRVKPMLWLLTLLALILGCTLALGGLIFATINVVSMGFAAILLGLAVDYAVVHYQEALAHPNLSIPQIRHAIAPSIFWAAVTTIAAFLVLNFGGLPGLGQLGTLVGLGVALAACIMIFEFLPPLFPERRQKPQIAAPVVPSPGGAPTILKPSRAWIVFCATVIVLLLTTGVLLFGLPSIDPTAKPLRPRGSLAYETLEQIQTNLNQQSLLYIVGGRTAEDVAQRLDQVEAVLSRAVSNQLIAEFKSAAPLWPRPAFQIQNRPIARQLAGEREILRRAAKTNGFAESALGLTESVLSTWRAASETPGVFWPTNRMSQ